MNAKQFFHYISYLQYPLMMVAIFFVIKPYLGGIENAFKDVNVFLENINNMLIFMGLAISFSTLQDTTKTQNEFSRKIWSNGKKSKIFLTLLSVAIILVLNFGIFAYFFTSNNKIEQLAFGTIVFGIGLIGMLKSAIEMAHFHRIN